MPKNNEAILNKIREIKWEPWLERPDFAFSLSLFEDSGRPESFETIGIPGTEVDTQLFQKGIWYEHPDLYKKMDSGIHKYLQNHSMFDITASLERHFQQGQTSINDMIQNYTPLEDKYARVYELLKLSSTFIWLAHGIESYYQQILNTEVPKYVSGDVNKFIGDASFPNKKNAHALFEQMLRQDKPAKEIQDNFGWLKMRDGFAEIFSIDEIEGMKQDLKPATPHHEVAIPEPLQDLFAQIQELVYFRTARTDVYYQLFYLARPILEAIAEKYNISPFPDLKYYRANSFLEGRAERFNPDLSFAYYRGQSIFQNEPILSETKKNTTKECKGFIAYAGKTTGTVKIVRNISELGKVENGDILVTQMTFPSFLPAMLRAAAFVTDEGGITCHAAIVAREMHKPCITGTKNATKILKDGDLVEVDAEHGIVKII